MHRCPKCNEPVIDRVALLCRNCHEPLPEEWLMTPEQIAELIKLDAHAKAEHRAAMNDLDSIRTETDGPL